MILGLGDEGRGTLRRDLSRLPSRAGEEARREAREWREALWCLGLGVLAIFGLWGGGEGEGWPIYGG